MITPLTTRIAALSLAALCALPSLAQDPSPEATPQPGLFERARERRQARKLAREQRPQAAAPVDITEPMPQTQPARPAAAQTLPITQPGDYSGTLVHAGLTRHYRLHVPASYTPSRATPLVLAFHGGGGHMDIQANDAYYGQVTLSEQTGHIVAFPSGYSKLPSGKLATWNAGRCCAAARDAKSDDVGFIRALIPRLQSQLTIDAGRIYAQGMSNGGMFAYRLACEMPEVFKAIAAVAGTDNTDTCTPSRPISVLHIHALDDERVLFNGGAGKPSSRVTEHTSVPDTLAKWVKLNECNTTPTRVLEHAGAYCEAYTGCRSGVEVRLCVTEQGGHSWPGGTKPRGQKASTAALSANTVMADFFGLR